MTDRYIRRFALPQRLYTDGAPVVLAAGVLLEDTRSPRLVAQLKWKSVDPRTVTALTVSVRCPDAGRTDTVFTYGDLQAARGQAFGQYTAVVLPWSDAQSMEVRAVSAVFGDGTVWRAAEDARWESLPAFTALDEAVGDASLLALSRGLPSSRYAYWSGQGIWYCACGSVNRGGETTCHRCGCQKETAARLATAAGLAAVRQAQLDEAARQRMEEVRARLRAEKAAPAAGAEAAASGQTDAQAAKPGAGKKRGKMAAILAVAVVVIAAAAFLLPKLGSGGLGIGAEELHVTAPGDGETVTFTVEENDEGVCIVTPELVQAQFPQAEYFNMEGVPNMGRRHRHLPHRQLPDGPAGHQPGPAGLPGGVGQLQCQR